MQGKPAKRVPYSVDVRLLFCKAVQEPEGVKPLAHLLVEEGFRPAEATDDYRFFASPDIDALVEAHSTDWTSVSEPGLHTLRCVGFGVLLDGYSQEQAHCNFRWDLFKSGMSMVSVAASVAALPAECASRYSPFGARFLSLAIRLYPLARPVFGYLSDPDRDPQPWPFEGIVKRRRIATLNWVNLFGPEYVERYGRELLAGIPGYRTEDLPDGGLLYQSRPHITVDDRRQHRAWQREATQYLAAHGIRLRWRNVFYP